MFLSRTKVSLHRTHTAEFLFSYLLKIQVPCSRSLLSNLGIWDSLPCHLAVVPLDTQQLHCIQFFMRCALFFHTKRVISFLLCPILNLN